MGEFPNKATQFKKGNPGGGRPPSRPIAAAIKEMLDKNDGQAIAALAAVTLKQALKGDIRHIKEILDRVDGKVVEQLNIESTNENINRYPGLTPKLLDMVAEEEGGPE